MRDYELVMVLSPEVDQERVDGVVDRVTQYIADRGGSVEEKESWGLRRLAYPIQRFREGNYVRARFSFEPDSTKGLEASLKTSAEIIRFLLIKRDPKSQPKSKQA